MGKILIILGFEVLLVIAGFVLNEEFMRDNLLALSVACIAVIGIGWIMDRNPKGEQSSRWIPLRQAKAAIRDHVQNRREGSDYVAMSVAANMDGGIDLSEHLFDLCEKGYLIAGGSRDTEGRVRLIPYSTIRNSEHDLYHPEDRDGLHIVDDMGVRWHLKSIDRRSLKRFIEGNKMKTLKECQNGKIEEFIAEHEADPDGDLDKLDAVIKRPVQESAKATRPASPQASSDD